MKKAIIFGIVFLLSLQLVLSLGVQPARTTIAIEDGNEFSKTFWVVNNDNIDLEVDLSVEGAMKEFIHLEKDYVELSAEDDFKIVNYAVNLPTEIPPGNSIADIIIEQRVGEEEGSMSARVVIKHKINILGPFPDKYVKAKINFHDQGDTVEFVSEIENLGKLDIDSVHTTFHVQGRDKREHIIQTDQKPLKRGKEVLLKAVLDKEILGDGEFEVFAVTSYDTFNFDLIKNLVVGKPEIDITYFDKYFIADEINPFSLDLANRWNKKLENVFVEVEVNKNNQKLDGFRTRSIDLSAYMSERIEDYYDAVGREEGEYTFDMIVSFWSNYRMQTERFEVELLSEEEYRALPIHETTAPESKVSNSTVLLLVALSGIIGYMFVYIIWHLKKKKDI